MDVLFFSVGSIYGEWIGLALVHTYTQNGGILEDRILNGSHTSWWRRLFILHTYLIGTYHEH